MKSKRNIWMRIPVFFLSGIILYVWGFFILIFSLVQLVWLLINNKKEKVFLNISSMFSSQVYNFFRYVSFLSEEMPFPFGKIKKKNYSLKFFKYLSITSFVPEEIFNLFSGFQ